MDNFNKGSYKVLNVHADLLDLVNEIVVTSSFIVNQENLTTGSFLGQWMLVAEWDDVHPYPHGGVSVGVDTFLDKVGTTISKCTLSFKDVCKFWHMTHTHTHTQLYIMHMRRFHETLN